uniref:Uncharacterized protein n=1 Tax=Arundo donax TaxID=35708 RepID=A0A0A9HP94_ARUDO
MICQVLDYLRSTQGMALPEDEICMKCCLSIDLLWSSVFAICRVHSVS